MKLLFPALTSLLGASYVLAEDAFDKNVGRFVRRLNVRGAAVAFYDTEAMNEPIVRGFGKIDSSGSASVTGDTAFMLASVSKVFAGATVSVLLDQGLLSSLDDDICDVIPSDWKDSACRHPDYPNTPVTWRMLVTHRSALTPDIAEVRDNDGRTRLPSYGPEGGYWGDATGNPTCSLRDAVGFYRDYLTDKETETDVGSTMTVEGGSALNWYEAGEAAGGAWESWAPGARVSYSNFAVGYIPALVELLTGQRYTDFSREHLFEPLGMSQTAWFLEDLPRSDDVAMPVDYYHYLIGRGEYEDIGHYCYIDYASGQLYSSADDMAKWALSMLQYGAPTLWSETTGKEAVQCQERDGNGNAPGDCEFGINWIRLDNSMKFRKTFSWLRKYKKYDWTDGIMHDGSEAGVQTQLLILPVAQVFAVVLTNTETFRGVAAQRIAGKLPNAMRKRIINILPFV